ncbi:helix-turn-helix domain-containing protein [Actinokineospora sp. NBRC 105648]|uniref:helix-turn-helix domain-containing protein n=1 Tax=Actinokineospora sp. NBRC 105648 TaxID=3032206 RepID=UPI002555866C|nr:helix-turn-helix domain-containing protein [Actinokineospora sp. NBRC 105648]
MGVHKFARPARDSEEERLLRKLAASRTVPRWLGQRAQIIALSWDCVSTEDIAEQVGLRPRTVRAWLRRFDSGGIGGLADLPRSGRPPQLSQTDRGRLVRLAATGGTEPWTLSRLTAAARALGIEVSRSQLRRVLIDAGVAWAEVPGNTCRTASE